jgi:thiamine-phosphate pyrophosphorylase
MPLAFPSFYVIMDAVLSGSSTIALAEQLASAGAELMQYRDKQGSSRLLFETSQMLVRRLELFPVRLIVNDRPDIAALVGAGGVHIGQDDLPVAGARTIIGSERWVGCSTHTLEQVREAGRTAADYIAFGPIFPTTTKAAADPTVGVEGLRRARELTRKPLVAIGGITLERAEQVWRAGADSVAVARDVLAARDPAARLQEYRELATHVFGKQS